MNTNLIFGKDHLYWQIASRTDRKKEIEMTNMKNKMEAILYSTQPLKG